MQRAGCQICYAGGQRAFGRGDQQCHQRGGWCCQGIYRVDDVCNSNNIDGIGELDGPHSRCIEILARLVECLLANGVHTKVQAIRGGTIPYLVFSTKDESFKRLHYLNHPSDDWPSQRTL